MHDDHTSLGPHLVKSPGIKIYLLSYKVYTANEILYYFQRYTAVFSLKQSLHRNIWRADAYLPKNLGKKTEIIQRLATKGHRSDITYTNPGLKHHVYIGKFEPIKCQCCPHIETSQLICTANQLTDFYMRATLPSNGLNGNASISKESIYCIHYPL